MQCLKQWFKFMQIKRHQLIAGTQKKDEDNTSEANQSKVDIMVL